jgi:hypothetical protein
MAFKSKKITVKPCPICKQTDMVIPIVYGYPSNELFKKVDKGLVKLGGCCIEPEKPKYYCKRDGMEF